MLNLLALGGASALAGAALLVAQPFARAQDGGTCANDETGLSLPPGFCATIFADNIGHARHMAVNADGTVYVNTWMSQYFRTPPPAGGFVVALRDTDGDGKAERIDRFGTTPRADGMGGGTGIALWKDGLFVEVDDRIVRYTLRKGEAVPAGEPVVVVDSLPMSGDHMMKAIAIDKAGNLFMNSGSPSNVCEKANRQPGSLGKDPCDELATRAGVWRYSATRTGQHFSANERYATGIRNTGGLAFDGDGRLFAVQHGRDQLAQSWPALYTTQQGAELPAEELLEVRKGDDFGWPYCYFDGFQNKLVLAPEYGGDGGKAVGRCASKKGPVAAYGAHWAPTGLAFYPSGQFPAAYKGGMFIAFHGSWNRAPLPQDGFRIEFQPLANGAASGKSILFADGFTGPGKATGGATHRPTGVAVGPDGALYISDDVLGRIWKVTYKGPANAALTAARPVVYAQAAQTGGSAPVPPGFTAEQVALGSRIYRGIERSGTCQGCHGPDGAGSTLGPALTGQEWLWTDGSVASLAKVIGEGVTTPKKYPTGMPAKGGTEMSDADVQAVAAYVWTLSQKK
jgi:glucose/arabinose dehydrogenase/cytochrome c553